jgi:hypothetical protein
MSIEILNDPPPAEKNYLRRVTDEIKALEVGQSFICDQETARCFVMWAKYNGKKATTKKLEDNKYQAWRIR